MGELSVNISQSERSRIQHKAVELIYRTASAKNYNKDFRKQITLEIININLEEFRAHLDSAITPFLHYVKNYEYSRAISNIHLPNDLRIYELSEPDYHTSTSKSVLRRFNCLESLQFEELGINPDFTKGDKTLFPFVNYNERVLRIPRDIVDKIEAHNIHMDAEFEALGTQLRTLLHTISLCKTTKAFYLAIPNLSSLFPLSVQRKIRNKNDKEPEQLTDEQQALVDATSSIATANLIGE